MILWFLPLHGPFFPLSGTIFHTLRLNKQNFTTIECLKSLLTCLYQLDSFQVLPIFRLLIDIFAELLAILWFLPTLWAIFPPYGDFFNTLRLNKENLTTIECLKCIIKCLFQLVFKFSQFLDFKLTYLLNYWRFCDFDPSMGP